jgi:uncharacterized FlaG/YvyC family protein
MALLTNAIGAGPLNTANTSGPAKSNRQHETAGSGQSAGPSALPTPAVKVRVTARTAPAAPERQEHTANDHTEVVRTSSLQDHPAALQTVKRAVFEHDELSGLSVVKFLDSKGNVVMQVPPENYLKTVQLLREFGGVDLQASSGETGNPDLTGLLLNKKV